MAKGDYPTGALVEVLREYRDDGGSHEVYEQAKQELKNLLMCLVQLEAAQQSVQRTANGACENCGNNCWKLVCETCGAE